MLFEKIRFEKQSDETMYPYLTLFKWINWRLEPVWELKDHYPPFIDPVTRGWGGPYYVLEVDINCEADLGRVEVYEANDPGAFFHVTVDGRQLKGLIEQELELQSWRVRYGPTLTRLPPFKFRSLL